MREQKVPVRSILRVLLGLVIAGSGVLILACNFNYFPAVIGQTSTIAVPAQTDPATSEPITATGATDRAQVSPCRAYFIDVGEGDSELLVTPAGKTILIDGGEEQSGTLAFLQAHQVNHIDLMIASHPHADHIGGLIDVLEAMKVDTIAVNGRTNNTQTFKRFLDLITSTGAGYEELSTGDAFSIDGVSFSVVAPDKDYAPDDLDNTSLVILAQCYQTRILYTGDMEKEEENRLLASKAEIKADILKVGHHGSNTSTSYNFMMAVSPAVAIYSAGAGNNYHHPHPSVINRLKSYKKIVYGTDINGLISVEILPTGYTTQKEK
jgi:competence protein ComEC